MTKTPRRVLLLAPPVVQPVAPFLALPSLTAYLRALGHEVVQRDLNVDFYQWLHGEKGAARFAELAAECGVLDRADLAFFRARLAMMPTLFARMHSESVYNEPGRIFEEAYENYCNLGLRPPQDPASIEAHKIFWGKVFDAFAANLQTWSGFDVVGVSVFADTQIVPGQALARWLRARAGAKWLLAGGGIFSETAQDSGSADTWRDFDGVVFYEGEKPLEALLEDMDSPENVDNLLWFDAAGIKHDPRMKSLDLSMDGLPTPCFDGLPLDRYLLQQLVLPICATRACYWNKCTFCTLSERTSGGVFRMRKAETVVEDIARLKRETGAKIFRFIDDSIPPHLINGIIDLLIETKLDVEWGCHLNVDERYLRPDFIRRLRASGCRLVSFGLESASPRVRRLIEKDPPKLDGIATLTRLIAALQDGGIRVGLSVILGLPTETEQEAQQTIDYLERHRAHINYLAINLFFLQASSTMHHQPEKNQLVVDHAHPRGFQPLGGMTHAQAQAMWEKLKTKAAGWAAVDSTFCAESAVLPQSVLRVCLNTSASKAATA